MSVSTQKRRRRELTCSEASATKPRQRLLHTDTVQTTRGLACYTTTGQSLTPSRPPYQILSVYFWCTGNHVTSDSTTLCTAALWQYSSPSRPHCFGCCPLTVICHDKPVILLDINGIRDQVLRTTSTTRYSRPKSIPTPKCPTPTSLAGRSRL